MRALTTAMLALALAACQPVEASSTHRLFLPVGDRAVPATAVPTPTAEVPTAVVRVATRAPTRTAIRTATRAPTRTVPPFASATPGDNTAPSAATSTATATRISEPSSSPTRAGTATRTPMAAAPAVTPTAQGPTPTATIAAFATALATPSDPVDRFERPDDAIWLGYAENGALWQTDGSTWGICAREACPTAPSDGGNWARIFSGHLDQRAEVKIRPRDRSAAGSAGVGLRASADWRQMLYVGLDPRGLVEVWTLVDGDWSDGPIVEIGTAFNALVTRTLEVSVIGAALDVRVDSALVLWQEPVLDAPADGTWVALFAATADPDPGRWPRLDDFRARPADSSTYSRIDLR